MAKPINFPERLEVRMTKEHRKVLKEIAKKLKTTESEAVRVCIFDYWEKI
jgi:hypothetical protein